MSDASYIHSNSHLTQSWCLSIQLMMTKELSFYFLFFIILFYFFNFYFYSPDAEILILAVSYDANLRTFFLQLFAMETLPNSRRGHHLLLS